MKFEEQKLLSAVLKSVIDLHAEQYAAFMVIITSLNLTDDELQLKISQYQTLYKDRVDQLKSDLFQQFGHIGIDDILNE